jgi:hypothetical protein
MKMENICHHCGHLLTGKGLYLGTPSGHGLYDGTPGSSGGSLKSISKAVKSGHLGDLVKKSALKNTASTLIHQGIPAATAGLGGLAGGVAGGVAGQLAGDDLANVVGKASGYGFRKGTEKHLKAREKKLLKALGGTNEFYHAKKYREAVNAYNKRPYEYKTKPYEKKGRRFEKGSSEAKEWGARMKAARDAKRKGKSNEALKNRLTGDWDIDPPSGSKQGRGIGSLPFS